MPRSPYFDHIEDLLRNINRFREQPSLLADAINTQLSHRALNKAWNNLPNNTYMCWDDFDAITANGDGECDHIGLFQHGTSFPAELQAWAAGLTAQSPLKWSDELALSAQSIMEALDGCTTQLS